LLHQLLGTTGAAGVMMALGASPAMAFHISASWLGVVVLVCSINLASFYRAGSPTLKLALSLSAVAAVESREHAWAIPLTALLTVWHLRSGMKS
jgi:hypothetical protein